MTALILQARLDSTRLPGKALMPLGESEEEPAAPGTLGASMLVRGTSMLVRGTSMLVRRASMLVRVMEALYQVPAEVRVLACPHGCVETFAPLAELAGFDILGGAKNDVLDRYCTVIRHYEPDWVIRATGDNPFVFADAAAALTTEAMALGADYSGYGGLPCGAGVEVVKATALIRAGAEAREPAEREHVCPYLYGHPELFYLHRPLAPQLWQGKDLRLTVDTPEDYLRARVVYEYLTESAGALEPPGTPKERYTGARIIRAARRVISMLEERE